MPPISKIKKTDNSYGLAILFITLISLMGIAFLVSGTIPDSGEVVGGFNSITPKPIVEFVDVEVPVFDCPQDFNTIVQTTCVEFGGLVSPVNQESLEQIQNNGGTCEQQETGVVCQPCLRIEQIGWTCVNSQYLES